MVTLEKAKTGGNKQRPRTILISETVSNSFKNIRLLLIL